MSLKRKIVAICIAILFVAMGLNTLITTRYFAREYLSARTSEVLVISQTLKAQLDRLLKMHIPLAELVGFEVMCQEAIIKYPGISYAMVVDPDGKILFHHDPSYHARILTKDVMSAAFKEDDGTLKKTTIAGEEFYDFFIPVHDSRDDLIAFIRTGFPVNHITGKIWKLISYSAVTAIISFIISSFLLIGLLYHWVSKPVATFIDDIKRIRHEWPSNQNHHIVTPSKDEIWQLAKAFNHMLNELRLSTVSKQYMDYILENMLNSLIITDQNYRISTVNQETLNLLGYKREELIGRPIAEILKISLEEAMDSTGSESAVKAIESSYLTKEGKLIPVLFSSSVLRGSNNEEQGFICVAQDITEIKTLRGFIPICSACKKIRDDKGYWNQVEKYISMHSQAQFSHGICPACAEKLYPDFVGDGNEEKLGSDPN